jgi:membrane-associated protein
VHLASSGFLLSSVLSPDRLVTNWGLIGLMAIIFAECGLLVGFFLPGDTLLFSAGVLVKKGTFDQPLWLVILLTFLAAVAGNQVGYEIGRRAGPSVFRRPNSRIFQPEYVERTRAFFEKYGSLAVVLARFVPIVRTFVTVMAGTGRMNYRTYTLYTILGGALWTSGVILLGYACGNIAIIADHVELLLLGAVALSVIPVIWHVLRTRKPNPGQA